MNKTVLLLYGGKSVEHEISIRSAINVYENIDKRNYNVLVVGIAKTGVWYLNSSVSKEISHGEKVAPVPSESGGALINVGTGKMLFFDIVFPVLHGTDGEDGGVQGIFKSYNVPLVGCTVLGAALAMDKILSKKVLEAAGIPVAEYLDYDHSQKEKFTYQYITEKIGTPFMIKAASLGSSVGISKVKSEADFDTALSESLQYGNQILFERFVKGRELECGVIGNEEPEATLPGEIILKKNYDFYTYQAKYQDDDAIDIVIPANIPNELSDQIRKHCVEAYKALRCDDYARVDLFLTENGQVIINEINTIPGFTNVSMFPMLWQNMGLSYVELINKLIILAVERWEKQNSYLTHYDKA